MDRTIISFDYATREILREKANFAILSGFLTELIEKQVTVIKVLDIEADPIINRIDLMAKIYDGEIAVFEIQFFDILDFWRKIPFNAFKAVVEQIKIGGKYDVKKVYSINISYYGFRVLDEYVFTATQNEFKGIHYDEVIPFTEKLDPKSFAPKDIHAEYFLIIPKMFEDEDERKRKSRHRIKEFVPKKPSKPKFDEWVYVLKHSVVKSEFTAAGIQAAGKKLNILKMTPAEKAYYELELKAFVMQKSVLQTALIKGEAEGLQKGLQKKEKIGIQKEKEKMVIRGRNKGHSIETIADFTDLSTEQIIKILKENGLT